MLQLGRVMPLQFQTELITRRICLFLHLLLGWGWRPQGRGHIAFTVEGVVLLVVSIAIGYYVSHLVLLKFLLM